MSCDRKNELVAIFTRNNNHFCAVWSFLLKKYAIVMKKTLKDCWMKRTNEGIFSLLNIAHSANDDSFPT